MTQEKKVVFIVEDDQFLAKAYQLKLQKEDVEIWTARDGKDALEYLKEDPPHIVLLDLMLPSLSGFDVLAEIRKSPTWRDVPVLILSNLGQPGDIERGKELGASGYIVKSNTKISVIMDRINEFIHSSSSSPDQSSNQQPNNQN